MLLIFLPDVVTYNDDTKRIVEDGLSSVVKGPFSWEIDQSIGCGMATLEVSESKIPTIIESFQNVRIVSADALMTQEVGLILLVADLTLPVEVTERQMSRLGAVLVVARREGDSVRFHMWAPARSVATMRGLPGVTRLYGSMGEVDDPARILVTVRDKRFFSGLAVEGVRRSDPSHYTCEVRLDDLGEFDDRARAESVAWHFIDRERNMAEGE